VSKAVEVATLLAQDCNLTPEQQKHVADYIQVAVDTEVKPWRTAALYLADCHAATAETEGMKKSASASQLRRYSAICQTALTAIEHGYITQVVRNPEPIIERLKSAINRIAERTK
jgi:hypothetical protein